MFRVWWTWLLVMFMITNIVAPLAVIYTAVIEYPEFSGLRGRRFPGQKKPREQPILPRGRIEIEQVLKNTAIIQPSSSFVISSSLSTNRQNPEIPAVEIF